MPQLLARIYKGWLRTVEAVGLCNRGTVSCCPEFVLVCIPLEGSISFDIDLPTQRTVCLVGWTFGLLCAVLHTLPKPWRQPRTRNPGSQVSNNFFKCWKPKTNEDPDQRWFLVKWINRQPYSGMRNLSLPEIKDKLLHCKLFPQHWDYDNQKGNGLP